MELVNITYLLRKAEALRFETKNRFEEMWYLGYIAAIRLIIDYIKKGDHNDTQRNG